MPSRQSLSLAALVLAAGTSAAAAAGCAALESGPAGIVVAVTDGDTLTLDSGLVVRLIGTQAPKLPLGRDDFVAWPLADESKAALEAMLLNQPVELRFGGARTDRYGRALAHVFAQNGQLWVQEAMVIRGLARVYSFPDNRLCLPELFTAESRARAQRLGIWADPYYSVRAAAQPADLLARAGNYELVEGRVLLADAVGERVYLNFGRYWKEDFTVVIEPSGLRAFAEGGLDPLTLEGALLRVRGWVEDTDGPRIEITHPEQIEILATR